MSSALRTRTLSRVILSTVVLATVWSLVVAADPTAAEQRSQSRFFFNDDGDRSVFLAKGPFHISQLHAPVDSLVGTAVSTLVYCVGDNLARYPSGVASGPDWRRTAYVDKPGNPYQRLYMVYQQFREQKIDPVETIMRHAIREGLEFVPSLRMNDGHFGQKERANNHPLTAKFWMDNPELAIVPRAEDYPNCLLDFTHDKVRWYRMAQISEIVRRYAADGIELDFTRHYQFFPTGRERPDLLTEIVRHTRTSLDERAKQDGKRRMLIVRVAHSLERCRALGCDVPTWIRQGLVDYVVPSSPDRYFSFDLPIVEFVPLAQGTKCRIVASPDSWKATLDMYRAGICNGYAKGQNDTYLFNFSTPRTEQREYYPYRDEDYALLRDLKGPATLWGRPKHFGSDFFLRGGRMKLEETDKPCHVEIYIGEDLTACRKAGILKRARWHVRMEDLGGGNEIELMIDGRRLGKTEATGPEILFDAVNPLPKLGLNILTVRLKGRVDQAAGRRPAVTWIGLSTEYDILGVGTQ